MRFILPSLLVFLSACSVANNTAQNSGVGFGGSNLGPFETASAAPYSQALAAGPVSPSRGYVQNGVPLFNYSSPELRNTGHPLSNVDAGKRALWMDDNELEFIELASVAVTINSKRAHMRRIDIDGHSFGVVEKINHGIVGALGNSKKSKARVAQFVGERTGCLPTGLVLAKTTYGMTRMIVIALAC